MSNITKVYDRVFVSDGPTAGNESLLRSLGISGVVCAALEYRHAYAEGIEVCRCGLHDEFPGAAVNTDDQLQVAVRELSRMYREGRTVLSHCHAGHNRSGAIVSGMLVFLGLKRNVYEAYGTIASCRELHIQPLILQHLSRLFPGDAT